MRAASFSNGQLEARYRRARHTWQSPTVFVENGTATKSLNELLKLGPWRGLDCIMIITHGMLGVSKAPEMGGVDVRTGSKINAAAIWFLLLPYKLLG